MALPRADRGRKHLALTAHTCHAGGHALPLVRLIQTYTDATRREGVACVSRLFLLVASCSDASVRRSHADRQPLRSRAPLVSRGAAPSATTPRECTSILLNAPLSSMLLAREAVAVALQIHRHARVRLLGVRVDATVQVAERGGRRDSSAPCSAAVGWLGATSRAVGRG